MCPNPTLVSQTAFPRKQTIESLIHVIRQQPKLAKDASSALIDVGQAIQSTVQPDELRALLRGSLLQEVYVRNSCLQTLQVRSSHNPCRVLLIDCQPFDLTDLDWSPELWISSHDDDEQNARLAVHLWEDNGLDVPESFLKDLQVYLGQCACRHFAGVLTFSPEHENAYVRSSTASAIAEAVEHWPQSITSTLSELQDFYREKVNGSFLYAPQHLIAL